MCENDPFLTTQQIYGVEKKTKKKKHTKCFKLYLSGNGLMCGLHLIIASLSSFLSVNKQDNQLSPNDDRNPVGPAPFYISTKPST